MPYCICVACDVVAVNGIATQEELRFLEMLRHELAVDRLTAAAVERGSAARYARYRDDAVSYTHLRAHET